MRYVVMLFPGPTLDVLFLGEKLLERIVSSRRRGGDRGFVDRRLGRRLNLGVDRQLRHDRSRVAELGPAAAAAGGDESLGG